MSKVKDLSFYYSLTSLFYFSLIILFIYFVFNTQVQTHGYASSVQGKIWDCIYGLSLHEVNTQGVMWSVIGEVFFFFFFRLNKIKKQGVMWFVIGEVFFFFIYYFIIIIIIFIFFFVFHKPTTGSPGGIGVFPPYPQQCEGHASRIMWGMSQTMVWGARS